tara:strand:- start:421 stop:1542 length:1122 start_codon:yes stop_codon:yes gene_type:complete
MKKIKYIFLILALISCSSTNESVNLNNETVSNNSSTTITENTNTTSSNETTTTVIVENYVFDNEKMSPFTGMELPPELWLKRPRRVIAFKIDNNINARPQSGLESADAVHEILVEGGMTRFLAFFYDKTSDYVGPVRSARPTDPTLIRPYGGTLVVSGATGGLVPAIRQMGVPVLEEQSAPSMFRISSRSAPHNLYADTELVRDVIDNKGYYFLQPGPDPLYPFGNNQDSWIPGANRVTIKYSEFTTVIWKLDGDKYSRFIIDGYSENKDQAVAHNVITRDSTENILSSETIVVLQGPIYIDEATTLPSLLTVGVGPVHIFNNGNLVKGTWRRNDVSKSFDLFDDNQDQIQVPPSTQWVHVLPLDGVVSWSDN